jgi:integrase
MPARKSGAVFRRPVKNRPANFRDLTRAEQEKYLEEKWTARYDGPRDPFTGKRKPVSKGGFPTARAAQQWLNEQLVAKSGGTHVAPSRMKLATYLREEWLPGLPAADLRSTTIESYRLGVDHDIVPRLGGITLQDLTPGRLEAFYAELLATGARNGRPLSKKTVRNIAACLHTALAKAMKLGYVPRNVAAAAKSPGGASPEMRTWDQEEVRAFLAYTREDRMYAAWRLMLTTGMRRGEVLGLRWSDVGLDLGRLQIISTRVKAGKETVTGPPKTSAGKRLIALDPATVAALRAWRKHQAEERLLIGSRYVNSGLVFTNEDGSGIRPDRFRLWFVGAVKRAGLSPIRLHDLRHTYATLALRAGTPVKVVSARLGHTSITITLGTYAHALPQDDEAAAGIIGAVIDG